MQTIITNLIYTVFKDFLKEINRRECLCSLKEFRYDQMNIPNYEDIFIRQLYLLRYFPAYVVEYYRMYRYLFNNYQVKPDYRILSIGTGCALDYYGLELALKEQNISSSNTTSQRTSSRSIHID